MSTLAPDPIRDPARLEALRRTELLDTPPEAAFDRLTRLASKILRTPLALVNLVDDRRQFSKSCFAPETWAGEREAPLSESFCRYAVISAEPLAIADARRDPRVRETGTVQELGIVSYLGIPLATSGGHVLGALCVAGFEPRAWREDEIDVLQDLAASVITEVELRQAVRRAEEMAEEARQERTARLELERAQRELRESEERFRLLVEGVRDYGIFMLDPGGRIVSWNAGAARISGYTEEEVLGRHFSLFYPEEAIRIGHPEHELEVAGREGRFEEEGWRVRKDGTRFWTHVIVTALRRDGELIGFAKITRDLTERKRAEEEREALLARERAARIEAEAGNRAKSEFLATMSHELRTPLNAILGYTDLLGMGVPEPLSPATEQYVGRIGLSAQHLLQLIEEILSFYRVEAGKERVEVEPVEVERITEEVQAVVEPLAAAKGLRLVMERGEPVRLETDPRKLRQILLNLLDNAVKYTEKGEVRFAVRREGERVCFAVRDTGVGIAPESQARIFEPFWQVEQSLTRKAGGTGLGLTVAQRFAGLLGGEIRVESAPGEGSTFTVCLPLRGTEAPGAPAPA
jgi:PAS domain S-box-containing protein